MKPPRALVVVRRRRTAHTQRWVHTMGNVGTAPDDAGARCEQCPENDVRDLPHAWSRPRGRTGASGADRPAPRQAPSTAAFGAAGQASAARGSLCRDQAEGARGLIDVAAFGPISAHGWTRSHSQVYVSAASGRHSNSSAAQTGHMITTLVASSPSGSSPEKAVQPRACSSLAQPHSPQINSTSPGIPVRIFDGSRVRCKGSPAPRCSEDRRRCPEAKPIGRRRPPGSRRGGARLTRR